MADAVQQHVSHFYIKLDGANAPEDLQSNLLEVLVDSSLHLPDTATLVIHDPKLKWVDHASLMAGKKLEIRAKMERHEDVLFVGEIVELEPSFADTTQHLTVRAFDKMHRLTRGRCVRSFVDMTDADIIRKVVQESGSGLNVRVQETGEVHKHVLQANQTDLEFLQERASALGFLLYCEDNELRCEPPATGAETIELKWLEDLNEFRPRLSTVAQVSEVTVRGWDVQRGKEIVGRASQGEGAPKLGTTIGGELAEQSHRLSAKYLVNDPVVRTQASADALAQAVTNRLLGRSVEAEGASIGNPLIAAGKRVKITRVGTRFSGEYFVTSANHSYGRDQGYKTHFTVSGHRPVDLLSLLSESREFRAVPMVGVAVVTDNADPDNLGRVKLKYPWLSEKDSSHWARVLSVGGGPNRGLEFIPEINDEVLVVFEQGDINHPYVLGGLWNGQDKPPKGSNQIVGGGKVKQRIIRSRSGHIVVLDDSDDKPGILIQDKTGNNLIEIDSKKNAMKIWIAGETEIRAKGKLTLESQANIEIKAATGISVDGGPSVNIKATNTEMVAQASAKVSAGALLDLQAAMVKIN